MTARDVIHLQMGLTLQTSGRILEVLKAAGYAVIELPKPLYGPDGAGGYGFPDNVSTCYGRVWEEDCDMDPDEARDLAAALLAACDVADAAEATS